MHWKDKVNSIAMIFTRSESMSEELVQDVFLKLWIGRHLLPEVKNFEDYFFIIIRNAAFSALRKKAVRSNVIPLEEEDLSLADISTEQRISEKELQSLIHEAVDQLPPRQKQAYQLVKVQGLSRKAAAAEMDISPQSVKTHLEKAMKLVRAWCLARLGSCLLFACAPWIKNLF